MLGICPQSREPPWGDLRTKQLPQRPWTGPDRSLLSHLISHDKEFLAGAVESEGSLRQRRWGRGVGDGGRLQWSTCGLQPSTGSPGFRDPHLKAGFRNRLPNFRRSGSGFTMFPAHVLLFPSCFSLPGSMNSKRKLGYQVDV